MKFTCMQPDLSRALGNARKALAHLTPKEAGLETVVITATEDRGVTMALSRPLFSVTGWLRANIHRPGQVRIGLDPMQQVVEAMQSQALRLELHPTAGLSITSGLASVNLPNMTPEPDTRRSQDTTSPETVLHLPASRLRQALQATTFAVSQDDHHPAIPRGVHLQTHEGNITLEATDEHRYARCAFPTEAPGNQRHEPVDIIVPLDAILTIQQCLQDRDTVAITLEPGTQRATFRHAGTTVQTRLLTGPYPRVEAQTSPRDQQDQDGTPPTTIEVSTNQLEQALSLCELTKRPGPRLMLLEAHEDRARVISTGMEQARVDVTLQAQVEGPRVTAAFNASYLLQVLQNVQACPSTLLTIESPTAPCTLTFPAQPGMLHAVMPTMIPGLEPQATQGASPAGR